jgi:hypothetical protein
MLGLDDSELVAVIVADAVCEDGEREAGRSMETVTVTQVGSVWPPLSATVKVRAVAGQNRVARSTARLRHRVGGAVGQISEGLSFPRRTTRALTMELDAVTLPVLDTDDVSLAVCVAVSDALAVTEDVCKRMEGRRRVEQRQ